MYLGWCLMCERENIILTGIPRSGTTLACYLLSKVENVIALVEPLKPSDFATLSDLELVRLLNDFFYIQRHSILTKKIVNSRSVGGKITDNVVSGKPDHITGKRTKIIDSNTLYVDKNLSADFLLFIKHPSFFSAKLAVLNKYYKCYAIIRNPLAVLLSWNSVEMAVTNGHAPAAEEHNAALKAVLAKEADKFNRQLILLSWFYSQYSLYLDNESIIKYEDIISSNGYNLQNLTGKNFSYDTENLVSKNNNSIYDQQLKFFLKDKLLCSKGSYWNYYSHNDLEF